MPSPIEELRAIYDRIPKVNCKRKCGAEFCCSVFDDGATHQIERDRVVQFYGDRPPRGLRCGYLESGTNLCSIYSMRPLICRLWGAVNMAQMRCPHGCEPEGGRWLTLTELQDIVTAMDDLSLRAAPTGRGIMPGSPQRAAGIMLLGQSWLQEIEASGEDTPAARQVRERLAGLQRGDIAP